LRLHLDGLPAVFHFDGAGDQFLAESVFPFARWRYGCADSLLGSGMGGTVVGALARSLFDDGLRWQWIAQDAAERRCALMGSMLDVPGFVDNYHQAVADYQDRLARQRKKRADQAAAKKAAATKRRSTLHAVG